MVCDFLPEIRTTIFSTKIIDIYVRQNLNRCNSTVQQILLSLQIKLNKMNKLKIMCEEKKRPQNSNQFFQRPPFNHGLKRQQPSGQFSSQPNNRTQRINNLNETGFLDMTPDYPISSEQEHSDELRILIDSGATSCYCRPNVLTNRKKLVVKKRIKTINGFTIIDNFYDARLFGISEIFYEIQNLEFNLLIGYNFLKKANINLDFENGIITCGNKTDKFFNINKPALISSRIINRKEIEENIINRITDLGNNLEDKPYVDNTLNYEKNTIDRLKFARK
ncbi:hypothetical protein DOY81_008110 [Sarcophaga bullata]|nr:hypothetical protein DOY81_008110 [Sarcophaga bullata]